MIVLYWQATNCKLKPVHKLDPVGNVITDEKEGGGDFLAELVGKVLTGEALSSDGITGLLKHGMSSVNTPSWEIVDDVIHEVELSSIVVVSQLFRSERCRNKQHQVVAEQLALF